MRRRVAGAAALGEVLATIVVLGFPACLGDPYAQLEPRMAALWLSNVSEARSIASMLRDLPQEVLPYYGLPIIALALGLYRCWHEIEPQRWGWIVVTTVLAVATLIAHLAGARQRDRECIGTGALSQRRWCAACRCRTGERFFWVWAAPC